MKNIEYNYKKKVSITVQVFLLLFTILILLGKEHLTNVLTEWLGSIIIALSTTALAQQLVYSVTNGILEKSLFIIEVKGRKYSISVFIIVAFLVKYLLF